MQEDLILWRTLVLIIQRMNKKQNFKEQNNLKPTNLFSQFTQKSLRSRSLFPRRPSATLISTHPHALASLGKALAVAASLFSLCLSTARSLSLSRICLPTWKTRRPAIFHCVGAAAVSPFISPSQVSLSTCALARGEDDCAGIDNKAAGRAASAAALGVGDL